MTDYYKTLGVSRSATADEIKQAYKSLAKIYHPDRGGDKAKFQLLQEAYDTLSDQEKKNIYDNPNPLGNLFGNGFPFNVNINDMFGMKTNNIFKKADHHYKCNITLAEVYTGVTKNFNLKRNTVCVSCKKICNSCNGVGMISKRIQMGPMINIINQQCGQCNGSGKVRNDSKCDMCNSSGTIEESKVIELALPKGVEDGKTYTYEGWGEEATKDNEKSGNLIIIVGIEEHPVLKRDGLNLKTQIDLTFKESITGKKITIHHFESSLEVDTRNFGLINPLEQYIIKNKGLESSTNNKGDMYIKFNINYNKKILSDDEITIINEVFDKVNIS